VRGSHLLTRPFYRPTPPWPDFIFSPPVPAPQHLTLFANTQKNSYGVVLSIDSDVARVSSFSGSSMGSVVSFCSPEGHGLNILGIVLNLQESHLEVAIASYGDSSVLGVGCLAQLHSDELNLDYFAPSSGCVFDALGTNLIDVATFDNSDFVVDALSTHYPLLDFNDYHSYNSFTSLAGVISSRRRFHSEPTPYWGRYADLLQIAGTPDQPFGIVSDPKRVIAGYFLVQIFTFENEDLGLTPFYVIHRSDVSLYVLVLPLNWEELGVKPGCRLYPVEPTPFILFLNNLLWSMPWPIIEFMFLNLGRLPKTPK